MNARPAVARDAQSGCIICALDGTRPLPAAEAFRVKGFSILKCPRCGLLWTRAGPDFNPDSIYTEGYFQGKVPDGYLDYVGSERFLGREYRARVSLIRAYQPDGRLFEIGSASGGFLQEASRYYSVQGVDVSEFAVQVARRKGLDVLCGHFEALQALRPPYDAIVMFDTIEHLMDPVDTLRAVHRHLRPGGFLFISTGDSHSLCARFLGPRWRLMTPPQHLWFFGVRGISVMLQGLGFRVLSSHHPWRFVPLTLIWYQFFRGRARPLPRILQRIVIPVNLYDTMMIVAAKTA